MHKTPILIAEKDEDLLDVLHLMLEEDFEITGVGNGKKAIKLITDNLYEFVIIDEHLHPHGGMEICQFIYDLPDKDRPGIIILSDNMNDESIKAAFALGVGDYIQKPFNIVAFHQRLMRYSQDLANIDALRDKDLKQTTVAETAMKQASSYGQGLELLAKLNQSRDIQSFLNDLTKGLLTQGYHTAVEFRYHDEFYRFDSDAGQCKDNEIKVFQLLHDKGRIYNFGKRVIFNEVNTSILIKNMPASGTISYDAAIDLFAKIVPALNSRFIALMHTQAMNSTKQVLGETIQMVTHSLAELEQERRSHLQDIAASIGISFHELELTEIQEQFFLQLIESKLSQNSGTEQFGQVIELLKSCMEELDDEESLPLINEDEEDHDDDIELF